MFDNTYAQLPSRFFEHVKPAGAPAPKLLAWNQPLAESLGLANLATTDAQRADIFAGNLMPDGAEPIAQGYAGHQFANFVPQLGDGRALLLGEVIDGDGRRFDIQLKGSGPTPYSRGGDGKSALGPVIREYLLSEAMFELGVPTTRALAAVQTGEQVLREGMFPGGIFTRVAASHLRIGSFQFLAAQGDVEGVATLAKYAVERHYPDASEPSAPLGLFRNVVAAHAMLVARWMSLGFIHGVMNTDNTSISGETIDYGPCAFMDEFQRAKVFSSIDRQGRYAYQNQPDIAQWNLARLAECFLQDERDLPPFQETLAEFQPQFEAHYLGLMRRKLGLFDEATNDSGLVVQWLDHLEKTALDFTLSFRSLANRLDASPDTDFERAWHARLSAQSQTTEQSRALMLASNPRYIPRNHRVEEAIQGALVGDLAVFEDLQTVLRTPFTEQPALDHYATAPEPSERVTKTFCGT